MNQIASWNRVEDFYFNHEYFDTSNFDSEVASEAAKSDAGAVVHKVIITVPIHINDINKYLVEGKILRERDIVSCRKAEEGEQILAENDAPIKKDMQDRYVLEVKTNALDLRLKLDKLKQTSEGEMDASLIFATDGKIQFWSADNSND
jgi:hypothetical protein